MSRKFLEENEIAGEHQQVGVSVATIALVILFPFLIPVWGILFLIGILVPYKRKGKDGNYR